ncbi:conserved hypothetical protein [Alkaliphilus metalliredigens QYMF]|uniref:2-amino-4-ketopentanoate thiolase, alpha subunit n=1 Tax=Alkaliphilus metalliredigens (strain QYMF) TaxID=293826 RepID=A6TQQ4_ALKMQ|nr:2-amino-4-oxopentanoate thiolase subunit OrtA [Alkaliphilus metalliredigens]ABR48522.1 conserved hypothetical protein [Alkaliphilus metalliredigens QYMF]
MKIEKGTWVRIHDIVMEPSERAPQVPDDTKEVPLEMWIKGFLREEDVKVGDVVSVETITGRIVTGTLVEINPYYDHDFGRCVPELLKIGLQLKEILWGGQSDVK